MELKDKAVLVTGGGSGIGLGIAEALAREGCRVAITGRNQQRLIDAAEKVSGTFCAKHPSGLSGKRFLTPFPPIGNSSNRLPPILPPKNVRCPAALKIEAIIAAVVDLPLLPVTPTIGAGQFSMNSSSSEQSLAADCRAT